MVLFLKEIIIITSRAVSSPQPMHVPFMPFLGTRLINLCRVASLTSVRLLRRYDLEL